MMAAKVHVLDLRRYDSGEVKRRIEAVINNSFGGLFSSGDKVLLKPNLLMAVSPERAITTHPVIVEAVGTILKERGCEVYIADNPSVFYSVTIDDIYNHTGMADVASRCGFNLVYPGRSYVVGGMPFSSWTKEFKLVNLPKVKTHNITILTAALKNLYGCIPGAAKAHLHRLYPRTDEFVKVLVKIYGIIRPVLTIADGITSLEGDGPARKGIPVDTGFVVVGQDVLAVDYVIGGLLGIGMEDNPLLVEAKRQGLFHEEDVTVDSDFSGAYTRRSFRLPSSFTLNRVPAFLLKIMGSLFRIKPDVERPRCVGCADCVRVCPAEAITLLRGKAVIDYSRCIFCFCCNEACRFGAMKVKKSLLLRMMEAK